MSITRRTPTSNDARCTLCPGVMILWADQGKHTTHLTQPAPPPPPAPTVTTEQFSGAADTLPASMIRVGKEAGGYGIETFAADPDLAGLDGNGNLRVSAIKNADGSWRGGIVKLAKQVTLNKPTTIRIRAKLPATTGAFPALWLINSLAGELGGNYAEIDLAELFPGGGWQGQGAYFTVHDWSVSPQQGTNLKPKVLTDDFHEWKMVATPEPNGSLSLSIDGQDQGAITQAQVPRWVWDDKPMWLVFNVAVSGKWSGATVPDPATSRIDMLIDFVEVTQ